MSFWIVQGLNGLQFSMLLFLLSIGLTVIFGLMHFVNLAHGALYALGAYVGVTAAAFAGSYWGAFFAAPLIVALAGMVLYAGLIRRMRKAGPMNQVLVTFGLIFVFLDIFRMVWGDFALSIAEPALFSGRSQIFGVVYPPIACSSSGSG
jgi:branched-chain amino acid transport system permease protein